MTRKLEKQLKKLPALAGVYLFKDKKGMVIYVGKSANLKSRVRSYFQQGAKFYNAAKVKMLAVIVSVEIIETGSEIEALVKETELIKKIKPRFNVLMRDSKNYLFVEITKEDYPRVLITHQPLRNSKFKIQNSIGPFTDARALRKTLRLLRPIFPYYTKKQAPTRLEVQLGLVPNDGTGKAEYKKNILSIKKILTGKNKLVQRSLRNEIKQLAKEKKYEKAKILVGRLASLENVINHAHVLGSTDTVLPLFQDVRPNFKLLGLKIEPKRIETYDISNISGKEAVGSMVVFERTGDGTYKPKKSDYRKFKIKTIKGANDTGMMREVLERRLEHKEWQKPDLMVIDGGKGQLSAALLALGKKKIPIIALAKKLEEVYFPNKKQPVLAEILGSETKRLLRVMRDETHRFAIKFHRRLHRKAVIK